MISIIFSKTAVILYVIILFAGINVFYSMQSGFREEDILAKQAENIVKIGENLLNESSIIYDTGISGRIELKNNAITIFRDRKNMTRVSFAEFNPEIIEFEGIINISKSGGVVIIND